MTGGLGFVRDSTNTLKGNRRLLTNLKESHFKPTKTKSDFTRRNKKPVKADEKILKQIKATVIKNNRLDLIKRLIVLLLALTLVTIAIYFIAY
ncbi:hypothetical protein DMA11_21880 [Marinilabiliaceae bacterium JC017]|nr:hypothetical protein DMA11_21880 [Marinilabiliaceae bacterium JC017]